MQRGAEVKRTNSIYPFHYQNAISDGKKIWYLAIVYSLLIEIDLSTGLASTTELSGDNKVWSFRTILKKDNRIFILPYYENKVIEVNLANGMIKPHLLDDDFTSKKRMCIINAHFINDDLVLCVGKSKALIVNTLDWSKRFLNMIDESNELDKSIKSLHVLFNHNFVYCFYEGIKRVTCLNANTNEIYNDDWIANSNCNEVIERISFYEDHYYVISRIDNRIFLQIFSTLWEIIGELFVENRMDQDRNYYESFSDMVFYKNDLWLIPAQATGFYRIGLKNLQIEFYKPVNPIETKGYRYTHFEFYHYMKGTMVDKKTFCSVNPWKESLLSIDMEKGTLEERGIFFDPNGLRNLRKAMISVDGGVCDETNFAMGLDGFIEYILDEAR